jgi:bacillithiol biosynthesis deacetylase BshB1
MPFDSATVVSPVDLLGFGPHPDDLEIGMAGTLAKHAALGYAVGLCDLTRGELGSNGTPEDRVAEAEAARRVLGAAWRVNLRLPDGGLEESDDYVRQIARVVRRAQPRAVAVPARIDRHPDHVRGHDLLLAGVFKAGLRRYDTGEAPWHAEWVCFYFINDSATPSFVVDVSDVYEVKRRALACHHSQFARQGANATATRLNTPLFLQLIESRDALFGSQAGVRFAEGFLVREPVMRPLLIDRWPAPPPRG